MSEPHATVAGPLPDMNEEDVLALADSIGTASANIFNEMLPRLVERLVGPGEPAREALANGGMVLNDCTVVIRLNPDNDQVEFFCDVGLPRSHYLESTYRSAMEFNLCRTYPGVVFGVHPESGRLVATTAVPALLVSDDEVCAQTLQMMTQVVSQLRAARTFSLEDD